MSNTQRLGYLTVAYPESMPDQWKEDLEMLPFGYACCTHDKDVWKSDGVINGVPHKAGEPKKAHTHFFFQGVPTSAQKKLIHAILGVNYGEDCRSANGAYDYLTHENDPDKYHYPKESIAYSPKWSQEAFDAHYTPKRNLKAEVGMIITKRNIVEYAELMEILFEMDDEELQQEASKYWVTKYIDSRRNGLKKALEKEIADIRAKGREKASTRQLSPSEAEEVERMYAGAKQMKLEDFVK